MFNTKYIWIVVFALMMAACVGLYYVDIETAQWLPGCWFHQLTGLQCPSCGSTRAVHALLHLHPLQALRHNYFIAISLPLLALVAFTTWSHTPHAQRLRPFIHHPYPFLAYALAFLAWFVLRNIYSV